MSDVLRSIYNYMSEYMVIYSNEPDLLFVRPDVYDYWMLERFVEMSYSMNHIDKTIFGAKIVICPRLNGNFVMYEKKVLDSIKPMDFYVDVYVDRLLVKYDEHKIGDMPNMFFERVKQYVPNEVLMAYEKGRY